MGSGSGAAESAESSAGACSEAGGAPEPAPEPEAPDETAGCCGGGEAEALGRGGGEGAARVCGGAERWRRSGARSGSSAASSGARADMCSLRLRAASSRALRVSSWAEEERKIRTGRCTENGLEPGAVEERAIAHSSCEMT